MAGPVSTAKQTRFLGGLFVVFLIANALISFSGQASLQAFGAGLAIPGGGFLLSIFDDGGLRCLGLPAWAGHLAAFVLVAAVFAGSVIFWFGAGNIILPPVVWIGSAALSAWLAPPVYLQASPWQLHSGPVLLLIITILPILRSYVRPKSSRPVVSTLQRSISSPLDHETLALGRFALDRALQPVDQFEGFQFVDQFQTAATRYQIAQTGYALALLNSRLPAFRGYLHQAQIKLIQKQCDPRIWRYWQYENAWGNFDLNPDPVARDNIMYTGFLAAQIAMFQRQTGDMRFSRPGALHLKSGKHHFSHDQGSLIDALFRGWQTSEYTLMPCEPNWIYPLCNAIGASAAIGTTEAKWQDIAPGFRQSLDQEFTAKDGRILPFRSSRTGIPSPHIGGAVAEAYPALWWNTSFPDVAAHQWAIARRNAVDDIELNLKHFWKVDTGDYRLSRAASLAGFAAAAAEMGDGDARDLALAALEDTCPHHINGNALMRPKASVFAHMTELIARLNEGNAIRTLMRKPLCPLDGPLLDTQHYHHLTVSRAEHKHTALQITLHPVSQWAQDLPLRISNLKTETPVTWRGSISGWAPPGSDGMIDIPLSPELSHKNEIQIIVEQQT